MHQFAFALLISAPLPAFACGGDLTIWETTLGWGIGLAIASALGYGVVVAVRRKDWTLAIGVIVLGLAFAFPVLFARC